MKLIGTKEFKKRKMKAIKKYTRGLNDVFDLKLRPWQAIVLSLLYIAGFALAVWMLSVTEEI